MSADRDRERLLQQLVHGEVDPSGALGSELKCIEDTLRHAAQVEADDLAALGEDHEPAAQSKTLSGFQRMAAVSAPSTLRTKWYKQMVALAAATVLVFTWWAWSESGARHRNRVYLGPEDAQTTPIQVEEFGVFAWQHTPAPGAQIKLIFTALTPQGIEQLERVEVGDAQSWDYAQRQQSAWPDQVLMTVVEVDATGGERIVQERLYSRLRQ